MQNERLSAVRKGLLWWFRWPGNPYVCVSAAVDFHGARAYLDALNADRGREPISVQHLAMAAVARVLAEFPVANARIYGSRIERQAHVGIGMPVNLLGHPEGRKRETGAAIVTDVERRSLRDLARETSRSVRAEREGAAHNPVLNALTNALDRAPYGLVALGLEALDRARRFEFAARLIDAQVPITTAITNAGAPFTLPEGLLFRGASVDIPQRLLHLGTIWALSAVQSEVLAVDGVPCVRPVLPVVLVFDHRLFDGVTAGRLLMRFGEIVMAPAAAFGPDGESVQR